MKTKTLLKITEDVDDIFHKHGYILDHFELSQTVWQIVKNRYPEEELKYSFETPKFQFSGRGQML